MDRWMRGLITLSRITIIALFAIAIWFSLVLYITMILKELCPMILASNFNSLVLIDAMALFGIYTIAIAGVDFCAIVITVYFMKVLDKLDI